MVWDNKVPRLGGSQPIEGCNNSEKPRCGAVAKDSRLAQRKQFPGVCNHSCRHGRLEKLVANPRKIPAIKKFALTRQKGLAAFFRVFVDHVFIGRKCRKRPSRSGSDAAAAVGQSLSVISMAGDGNRLRCRSLPNYAVVKSGHF